MLKHACFKTIFCLNINIFSIDSSLVWLEKIKSKVLAIFEPEDVEEKRSKSLYVRVITRFSLADWLTIWIYTILRKIILCVFVIHEWVWNRFFDRITGEENMFNGKCWANAKKYLKNEWDVSTTEKVCFIKCSGNTAQPLSADLYMTSSISLSVSHG